MDQRLITHGLEIPSEGYADQPYIVRTADGAWLCVITTGSGHEGDKGQHVVSRRSLDQGKTWGDPVDVEPADGPEASYAVLLATPAGRVYCFYNHNTDRIKTARTEDGKEVSRVDSMGHYVFKFSDDGGRTWSPQRHDLPVREFACDRDNVYQGKLRFFWNVGKPLIRSDGSVLLTLHKIGALGAGFMCQSEGAFVRSDNILAERDPARLRFETLPEGDVGLVAPSGGGGRIAEEQSTVELSDGSLYSVYRTVAGHPACAYSRDGGRTWTPPAYKTIGPGQETRRFKHPRAANFVWRTSGGRFLYWFHNHGGPRVHQTPNWSPYDDRNPAWLVAGREVPGPDGPLLAWSEPEILLYDDDPMVRMSYPDLVEESGRWFVTETQKSIGRVHEIDPTLIAGLLAQHETASVAANGLALDAAIPKGAASAPLAMPALPEFSVRNWADPAYRTRSTREGFSLNLWLRLDALAPGQILFDTRDELGRGILLATADHGSLRLELADGRQLCAWASDRGSIAAGTLQHVVVTVDGGPRIITYIVNGRLCDGGDDRQFGWGRFSPTLFHVNGAKELKLGEPGVVRHVRVYTRAVRTSEAVGNWRAGCPGGCG
ncbi:MAG: hypothetical protein NTW19_19460 [Planctomycetota bacterium]|nr:hypothetical protein [Planctomycetota bacterium]